ncbi:MAG: glycosyltransferase family 4 protein [Polyangiales bacterium]
MPSARIQRFVFAVENNAGNAVYGQNLVRAIAGRSDVEVELLPIALIADDIWGRIPLFRSFYALGASARTATALYPQARRKQLDGMLIHSQSIALFSLELMRRIPTAISSDGTPLGLDRMAAGYYQPTYAPAFERMKHAWTKAAIRAAHTLIGWSRWVVDSYVNDYGADPARTAVIPPGVDTALWRPDPSRRPRDGKLRILFNGRDYARKGGDRILRWAAQTRWKHCEVHMVTTPEAPTAPNVIVHGHLRANSPELVALAQSCDIFALPTRGDCFSMAGLEAAATGMPLVISDVGGISDIIEEGKNGYLVPADDDAAFFERLDHLVTHETLRETLGQAARRTVEALFDAETNAKAVLRRMGLLDRETGHAPVVG